jgi:hypothetical protein
MNTRPLAAFTGFLIVLVIFFWAGALSPSSQVKAQSGQESRFERGFEIAPVPLNIEGKDPALVGLGSYLVNASSGCNDCHSAGPQTEYLPGRNPFFGQPVKINPATYLGCGRDFGPLLPTPGSPHMVSRNLTPDKNRAARGRAHFRSVSRDPQDGRRSRSRASSLHNRSNDQLSPAPIRRQQAASDGLAGLPEPDRARHSRHLRVPQHGAVHRGTAGDERSA